MQLNFSDIEHAWRKLFEAKDKWAFGVDLKAYLEQNRLVNRLDILVHYLVLKFYAKEEDREGKEVQLKQFLGEVLNGKSRFKRAERSIFKIRGG